MGGVPTPADSAVLDPLLQLRQLIRLEAEAPPNRLQGHEVEHCGCLDSSARHLENAHQGVRDGVEPSNAQVGDLERDLRGPHVSPAVGAQVRLSTALAAGGRALGEDGRDQGREARNVGGHDQDIPRLQLVVVIEQAQQDVAQHLHLPGRPVARVELDGVVAGPQLAGGIVEMPGRAARVQDVRLQPLKRSRRAFIEGVRVRRLHVEEQVLAVVLVVLGLCLQHDLEIPGEPAHGQEQWVVLVLDVF